MNSGDEQTELLRELVKWTRVGFYANVKSMLEETLNDEKKRLIYHLADGTVTVNKIRELASVSPNKATEVLRRCEALGLVETTPSGARRKLFLLEDFGLLPVADQ